MKRILSLATMFFVLAGGILLSQETEKPFSYTFEKGVGTCTFTGVSLDQVWSVAVKVLMGDKFRIVSSEKDSGNLVAERRPFASWNFGLQFYFEQKEQDVCVTTSGYIPKDNQQEGLGGLFQGAGQKKAFHKEEKKFYDKVAELLYRNDEKK